ncbi:MAG: hypothetical protein IH608_09080 [Proteobacteria bacterium]|nr:hypothetical protein [Pseudomonadota bacterium]
MVIWHAHLEANTMPSLQIRNLPKDVYDALAFRAQSENRSLAQQAIVELRRTAEVQTREQRRRILADSRDRVRAGEVRRFDLLPEDAVRADRDR